MVRLRRSVRSELEISSDGFGCGAPSQQPPLDTMGATSRPDRVRPSTGARPPRAGQRGIRCPRATASSRVRRDRGAGPDWAGRLRWAADERPDVRPYGPACHVAGGLATSEADLRRMRQTRFRRRSTPARTGVSVSDGRYRRCQACRRATLPPRSAAPRGAGRTTRPVPSRAERRTQTAPRNS
jgi:hypothetical protein